MNLPASQRPRCPECGATYPPDVRFCAVDGAALTLAGSGSDLIGRVLGGKYRVERLIGSGGMGDVFQVRHVRLDEKRALKLMQGSALTNPIAVERFRREAQQQNRIRHPNVATLYDFEEEADGTCFLVMEFVDGQSLGDLIRTKGALPVPRVASIVLQIAAALDAAHDENVVHRDLKPDNVLIARARDGSDRVKVVDFGIATLIQRSADTPALTSTGMVVGTPRYMSPEQLFSDTGEPIDGRSDTYALGLLSIEMLLGRLPFGSGELADVLRRAASAPPAISTIAPELALPAAVDAVFSTVLASDRNLRYTTASAFARDLIDAFALAGVSPGPDSVPAPTSLDSLAFSRTGIRTPVPPEATTDASVAGARAPGRRRPTWIMASIGVGALTAIGVYLATARPSDPTNQAVVQPSNSTRAAAPAPAPPQPVSPSLSSPSQPTLAQSSQALRSQPPRPGSDASGEVPAEVFAKLEEFRKLQAESAPASDVVAKQRIQTIRGLVPALNSARDRLLAGLMTIEALLVLDDTVSVCKLLPGLERQSQGTDLVPVVTLYRDSIPCVPRPE